MNTRNTVLIILGLLVVGALVWFGFNVREVALDTNQDGVVDERDGQPTDSPNNGASNEPQVLGDNVRLSTPRSGQTISSPLVIKGEARGWYFEGSFPVKLLDTNGKVLAQGPAQAKGDWMTTDWVPFEATLNFVSTVNGTGKLVFEKDNPSGLPENDASVSIPVILSASPTMSVKVFFGKTGAAECENVVSTNRTIAETSAVARAALNELLKGPTSNELSSGYLTSIPSGVSINSLEVRNGTAYVDFSETLENYGGGSCRVAAISSQIRETLKQFSTVNNVVISVNGRTEDILQP